MDTSTVTASSDHCREFTWLDALGAVARASVTQTKLRRWCKPIQDRLLTLFARKGLTCSLPGGETVRILPAYRFASWNLDEYFAFKRAAGAGSVALDVGANVGCYALLFGQWVGPTGKVFAFEPAPEAFVGLCRHLALNAQSAAVVPIQMALSDSSGLQSFLASGSHGENHLVITV